MPTGQARDRAVNTIVNGEIVQEVFPCRCMEGEDHIEGPLRSILPTPRTTVSPSQALRRSTTPAGATRTTTSARRPRAADPRARARLRSSGRTMLDSSCPE